MDYEVGRSALWTLGVVRPLIGAVLGIVAYFVLRVSLFQTHLLDGYELIYPAALGGFAVGFAERVLADIGVSSPRQSEGERDVAWEQEAQR
jgi:hypothetical protein